MAGERKRVMGELAAWQVEAIVGRMFGGKPADIKRMNPYRESEPYKRKTVAEIDYQNRRNWMVLDEFFGSKAWKRG